MATVAERDALLKKAAEDHLTAEEIKELKVLKELLKELKGYIEKKHDKVFSTTIIAQRARKEAAKEEAEKALASEKSVLKKTTIKTVFSPKRTRETS